MKLVPKAVEQGFLAATSPLADWLYRRHIQPNTITTIGAVLVVLSALAFGAGWIRSGGILLIGSGIVDTFDGQVARRGQRETKFGAFYDSTLDRVGDGVTFIGIAVFLLREPNVPWRVGTVTLCMVAVLSSLLVSYARARAEGLGLDCRVGLVQRAERLLAIGVPTIFVGRGQYTVTVLQVITAVLALMSTVTVIQRFVYVHSITRQERT
ncbi:MAG TPA: CDP-alcohol phosphatidyltransferase family protein [Gemmatimonadales bacterium]|nr:CDP-alcohol phosphatidyltransferase family protein [Gemmatimonadales bacterium]